jgi:hypothetical protein
MNKNMNTSTNCIKNKHIIYTLLQNKMTPYKLPSVKNIRHYKKIVPCMTNKKENAHQIHIQMHKNSNTNTDTNTNSLSLLNKEHYKYTRIIIISTLSGFMCYSSMHIYLFINNMILFFSS